MSAAKPHPRNRPGDVWAMVGLVVLVFLIYGWTCQYDFLEYDDGLYVFKNPAVLAGLTGESIRYAFRTVEGGSWMPLTWLSHQLDSTVFGEGPAGRHFHNVLLHALATGLLYGVLRRWNVSAGAALVVVWLFAIHPMRNESVAWIAERKDVLSGLCFVGGLLAYQRYVSNPRLANYFLLLLVAALGLMAKPMLVTFPFVLLLLDFWPARRVGRDWAALQRNWWPLVREKLPLLLLALLASAATYFSQEQSGAMGRWSEGLGNRVADVASNYWFYLQQTFWPADLTIVYPPHRISTGAVIALVTVCLVATGIVLRGAFRWPWLVVGWLWFVGMLVPVIGIVPVGMTMVADRYSYLPVIGLLLALVLHLQWWAGQHRIWRPVGAGVGILACVASLMLTIRDLPRWRNTETLFEAALKVAPHKVAYNNLGSHHIRRGNYERAIELADRAIELDPHFGPSYATRAMGYASLGQYASAKRDYDEAIRWGDRPLRISAANPGAGSAFDPESDWTVFADAMELRPRTAEDFLQRGISRSRLAQWEAAIADYSEAIRQAPDAAEAYYWRSGALNLTGRGGAALGDAERAVELRPEWADAYAARANVYVRSGNFTRALADQNRCLELAPTNALYFQNRAVTHLQLRQYRDAWADVKQCEALGGTPHPDFLRALQQASGGP